jgi:hypothetical protein
MPGRFLIAVSTAVLGAIGLTLWLTSDTQAIHRRIDGLFEAATFTSPLSPPASHLRARRFESLLADSVALDIPEAHLNATYPREELLSGFLYFLNDNHGCEFHDLSVASLTIDGSTATALVTLRPRVTPADRYAATPRALTLHFDHTSGAWLITSISVAP